MLNFIVLGLIPGTHLQITFSWVLLAAAVLMVIIEILYRRNYRSTAQHMAVVPAQLVQTMLAIRVPKRYRFDLIVRRRQYTFSVEL